MMINALRFMRMFSNIQYPFSNPLQKKQNKRMPRKHKISKIHKNLIFSLLFFGGFWCFRDLVAKNKLSMWLTLNLPDCVIQAGPEPETLNSLPPLNFKP
jgi:hypothetical protein